MLQGKLFSLGHFLVKHVAETGSNLLDGIALDAFHSLVEDIQDGCSITAIGIEAHVDAEKEDWFSHGNSRLSC
jgi:hypothetical protein